MGTQKKKKDFSILDFEKESGASEAIMYVDPKKQAPTNNNSGAIMAVSQKRETARTKTIQA